MTQADAPPPEETDATRGRPELFVVVGETLGRSLDPTVTVQSIADLLVPAFSDWCVVDLLRPDRGLETVASAHRDHRLVPDIAHLREAYPPMARREQVHAIYRAIDGGTTVVEVIGDDDLKRRAVDAEHLALLRRLGIGSHIVVALEGRGRVIGALSIVRAPDRPPFGPHEVVLAEEIARRTAVATDNALLHRAAQQSLELRDRFIALASHELRNPLGVVRGHWELLGRRIGRVADSLTDEDRQRIDASMTRLGQGIDQLQRLVEELLDVRRIASRSLELRRSEIDLATAVRQAADEIPDASAAARLRLDLPTEPVLGWWDRGRIEQLVANLLANALKYSPGDAPVDVTLAADGSLARLRVADAGIGIAAGELESIFDPFTRGTIAESEHYPGLGLGLALSREIVATHGGRMWAESEGEGLGSTFIVELERGSPPSTAEG